MDKERAARDIIAELLPIAPFDGWTQASLGSAAERAGYKRTDAIRVFPEGAMQAIDTYFRLADAAMVSALAGYHLETMKIRERIALAVRLWLEGQTQGREALRRAIALQSLPIYSHRAVRNLYRTVDAIWYAIGDTSTDFNFYTKRLLLAAVMSSTTLYWLNDTSPGHAQSWEFLNRRIEDVMRIEKAKAKLRGWLKNIHSEGERKSSRNA